MRKKLRIEPQARVDLLEIWHYIANDSLEAATRMVEKLEAEIRGLLPMPGKGHARTDVRDPRLRFCRSSLTSSLIVSISNP